LVTFRVADGEIIFPGPVDFQADLLECGQHISPVLDIAVFDFGNKVGVDSRFGLGPFVFIWHFTPAE